MAASLGKSFRRLLAQALAADEGQMRALIERLLPYDGSGKRMLRLENDDDRQLAPLAIVAALSADAVSGDEAEELKRQALAKPTEVRRPWWEVPPPGYERLSPEERRRLGYVRPLEEDPLRESILAWRGVAGRGDAAESGVPIVNNNKNTMENTMAAADAPPQIVANQKPNPL